MADEIVSHIDRYEIQASIGRGGMAVVYRARDPVSGETLALKQLTQGPGDRQFEKVTMLFEHEYHTLAQLAHPRIVAVKDYGIADQRPYYTMELLDGSDLREMAPVPWQRACSLLRDVASALSLLHSRHLIHRDLSPRNVRCTPDGRAKLIDFGAMAPMGLPSQVVGTPAYMAPEVLNGQMLDGRTDLFALGALAYWTLTRRHAYPARRLAQLTDVWRTNPPAPAALVQEIPVELSNLVLRMMRLDPLGRPSHAAEVIDDLTRIADLDENRSLEVAQSYLTMPSLVGRQDQLVSFRKRVLRAARGKGGSVLVEATGGQGRSRLLASFALEAKLAGALVVRASGQDCSGEPYGGLRLLVNDLLQSEATLARTAAAPFTTYLRDIAPQLYDQMDSLFPPSAVEADLRAESAPEGVVHWLTAIAERRYLCVMFDDVHRADKQTMAVLARLAAASQRRPLVVVASAVLDDRDYAEGVVARIAEDGARLVLRSLNEEQTHELLKSVFGDVSNLVVVAAWIHRIGRGVPAVTMDLAQYLVAEGAATFAKGRWVLPGDLAGLHLPEGLEQVVLARLRVLSPAAQQIARLRSLVTRFAPLAHRDYLSIFEGDLTREQVFQALDELLSAQILYVSGDGYTFSQRAVMNVVRESMDEPLRQTMHKRLARHYVKSPAYEGLVAGLHLFHGGDKEGARLQMAAHPVGLVDLHSVDTMLARDVQGIELLEGILRYAEQQGDRAVIYTYRKLMLQLSAVQDARLVDYDEVTLNQLRRDCGLIYWDEIDVPEAERFGKCLERAVQVYDSTPEDERGMHPFTAVQEFAVCAGILAGAYARVIGLDRMARLCEQLKHMVALSPAIDTLHRVLESSLRGLQLGANMDQDRVRLVEEFDQRIDGIDEVTRQGARYILSFYLAIYAAVEPDPRCLDLAKVLETNPNYLPMAWYVRGVYYQVLGRAAEAQHAWRQLELEQIDGADADHHMVVARIVEPQVALFGRDLAHMKRIARMTETEAARFEGWVPVDRVVQAGVHVLTGDLQAALALLDENMSTIAPGEHLGWHLAALFKAVAMRDLALQRRAQGRDPAPFARQVLKLTAMVDGEITRRPGLRWPQQEITLALSAIAHGLLDEHDQARACADEYMEQMEEAQRHGLFLGEAYAVQARLALWRADAEGFHVHAKLCGEQWRAGRMPTLVAMYEQLMESGRREADMTLASLMESQSAQDEGEEGQSSIALSVQTLLGACQGADERAKHALKLLVEEANGIAGYLYGVQDQGLSLLATFHAGVPDPGQDRVLLRYVATALDDSDEAVTRMVGDSRENDTQFTETNFRMHGQVDYHSFLLRSDAGHERVVTGVALLRREDGRVPSVSSELLAALSARLHEAGDVTAADVSLLASFHRKSNA